LQLQHAEAISPIQAPGGPEDGRRPAGIPGFGGFGSADGAPLEAPDSRTAAPAATPFVRDMPKVGRNEACPCGSGKKYKHCHGALQQASG